MKLTVTKPVEIDVAFIRIIVPVYGEDIPAECFGRRPSNPSIDNTRYHNGDRLDLTIGIDSGKVVGWPGGELDYEDKVRDEGVYILLNHCGEELARVSEDYVPNCLPGEYGDYLHLFVAEDGTVSDTDGNPWGEYCHEDSIRTSFFERDE